MIERAQTRSYSPAKRKEDSSSYFTFAAAEMAIGNTKVIVDVVAPGMGNAIWIYPIQKWNRPTWMGTDEHDEALRPLIENESASRALYKHTGSEI